VDLEVIVNVALMPNKCVSLRNFTASCVLSVLALKNTLKLTSKKNSYKLFHSTHINFKIAGLLYINLAMLKSAFYRTRINYFFAKHIAWVKLTCKRVRKQSKPSQMSSDLPILSQNCFDHSIPRNLALKFQLAVTVKKIRFKPTTCGCWCQTLGQIVFDLAINRLVRDVWLAGSFTAPARGWLERFRRLCGGFFRTL